MPRSWRCCVAWSFLFVLISSDFAICEDVTPKRLVLIGQGPDGHPAETHEYFPGMRILQKCLRNVPNLHIDLERADGDWHNGPALLDRADGVVLFVSEGARWIQSDPRRREAFTKLAARGGGLATLHWGMGTASAENVEGFVRLFGGCHGGPDRKYQVVEGNVLIQDTEHPITEGMTMFHIREEFYYRLKFPQADSRVHPLLSIVIDGQPETVAWSWERADGGRSFGFSGLHFHSNWKRPEYRQLVSRAALWTLKLPIPRQDFPAEVTSIDLRTK